MNNKTQTKHQELEIGTQFVFNGEPTPRAVLIEGLAKALGSVKLEARMFVFDTLHGTNYRRVRHDLMKQKRCAEFEASIGISRK